MSQEKVELQKAAKVSRKVQNKKNKTKQAIVKAIVAVVVLVLVAWIGYSIYSTVKNRGNDTKKEVNMDALQDYMEEVQNEIDGTEEAE